MKTLLRHRIETLELRADAAFPSQIEEAIQAAREIRHALLCKRLDSDTCLLGCDCDFDLLERDDNDFD